MWRKEMRKRHVTVVRCRLTCRLTSFSLLTGRDEHVHFSQVNYSLVFALSFYWYKLVIFMGLRYRFFWYYIVETLQKSLIINGWLFKKPTLTIKWKHIFFIKILIFLFYFHFLILKLIIFLVFFIFHIVNYLLFLVTLVYSYIHKIIIFSIVFIFLIFI